MKDTLLTKKQKAAIEAALSKQDYKKIIAELDKISTKHSGTAKMKDKRYVIAEIVRHITEENHKNLEREYYRAGLKILKLRSDNAKEVGIHILWRGYKHNIPAVTKWLHKITDDSNWEVREYAAGALSGTLTANPEFYSTLKKWVKDGSENIRRGVVLAAASLRDKNDPVKLKKAFDLFEPLMYDSSRYVKVNLGPFILGSYYGNNMPEVVLAFLYRMIKVKDPHVRWNVAMAFNNSFGYNFPNEAVKFLRMLSNDKDPVVERAVKSTLNHLRKRNKNLAL
ncbi:MAG TPA: HEAT repeat domain-containing protein [Ignavibacteria bacterium]|nr:HEAT repeat domain-containing protein [Ignavibacteria bacterium]HRF64462.1 HEAT repeat domain-containing protein [Ignavibacteria bacterium]HRJ04939.1 HEAT repeat domain-containing protein [Ignavibacteria bacterium]